MTKLERILRTIEYLALLYIVFFFSSRRRHTRCLSDWSSDVCSSDLRNRAAVSRCAGSLARPLVERCLAKDPAHRLTAARFLAELTAVCPSAADLSDWLPPAIVPAASPLAALAGLAAERNPAERTPAGAAPSSAQAAGQEVPPAPGVPPVA